MPSGSRRSQRRGYASQKRGGFADYIACARSHLGWLSLQRGDRSGARAHVEIAVTRWRELAKTYSYPFQWLALLPHLELLLDGPPSDEWCVSAAASIDMSQLKLPRSLERALEAVAASNPEDAGLRGTVEAALALARASGYL